MPDDLLRQLARLAADDSDGGRLAMSSTAIADMLWMARHLRPRDATQPAPDPSPATEEDSPPSGPELFGPMSPVPTIEFHPAAPVGSLASGDFRSASAVRIPAVAALPDALNISRALRPLKRRVPAPNRCELDEDRTATVFGETEVILPDYRPATERWLQADLVVDTSASMVIWQQSATELRSLLTRHGAFRDVRTWAFDGDRSEPVITPYAVGAADPPRARHPGELADPRGRRVILVLTDAVGAGWHCGAMLPNLALWARSCVLAIVQVLPKSMWPRAALDPTEVTGRIEPAEYPRFRPDRAEHASTDTREGTGRTYWVPVLRASRDWIEPWASMIASVDATPTKLQAIQVPEHPLAMSANSGQDARGASEPVAINPLDYLSWFRDGDTSVEAVELARYLAAAPLSLPVMRLVQHAMVPRSGPEHLAEVFLSGMLVRTDDASDGDPDAAVYEFRDGVRERLRRGLTQDEKLRVMDVLSSVSGVIAERFGVPTLDFRALVPFADASGPHRLPSASAPFARLVADNLRGLGGAYADLAASLAVAASEAEGQKVVGEIHVAQPKPRPKPNDPILRRIEAAKNAAIFELRVMSGDGKNFRVSAHTMTDETLDVSTTFPLSKRELDGRLREVEQAVAWSAASVGWIANRDQQPVKQLGAELFGFLFPEAVREHLSAERRLAAQDDVPVQVGLAVGPPELAALPWEFLYDPDQGEYLSLSAPVVRYLDLLGPIRPRNVIGPVQVLGMIVPPDPRNELAVQHEKRLLNAALAELKEAGQVELTWTDGPTWHDLLDSLDRIKPNVLHFTGLGGFDDKRQESALALADEDGSVDWRTARNVGEILGRQDSLRLVVLNSCMGAQAVLGNAYSSTAAALTRRGVQAVVAMQYEISDDAAITFARGMYDATVSGFGIDQAVTRARQDIKLSRGASFEWATPLLYLRSADPHLFDRSSSDLVAASARPHRSGRPGSVGSLRAGLLHEGQVWAVTFSPDGTRLATGSDDKTARIWDTTTDREITQLAHRHCVNAVAYSPDGTNLATGSDDGTARIWDTTTGREIARLAHRGLVLAVAYSPDGTHLATGVATDDDGAARIWDTTTGHEITRLAHRGPVYAVAYSPDGTHLATASADGTRIWGVVTGREITWLAQASVRAVAYSPDGTHLATGGEDGIICIWDTATSRRLTPLARNVKVKAVAYSPSGSFLAAGCDDGGARIWAISAAGAP